MITKLLFTGALIIFIVFLASLVMVDTKHSKGDSMDVEDNTTPVVDEHPPIEQKPVLNPPVQKQSEPFTLYQDYQNLPGIPDSYRSYLVAKQNQGLDSLVIKLDTDKKIFAITIDDGPIRWSKDLVDFAHTHQVPITFFLICNRLTDTNSQWYKNSPYVDVGIHSWSHQNLANLSDNAVKQDIQKCKQTFTQHGLETRLIRPPFGSFTPETVDVIENENLVGVLWSLDSQDYNGFSGDKLVSFVTNNLNPGDIFLTHDEISIRDLKRIVEYARQHDYQIVPLRQMLEPLLREKDNSDTIPNIPR